MPRNHLGAVILKVKSAVFIKPEISLFRLPTFLINYKNGKQEVMQLKVKNEEAIAFNYCSIK